MPRLPLICLSLALLWSGSEFRPCYAQRALIPRETTPPTEYTLGAGDQLTIRVVDMEEFADRTVRIDPSGLIDLPFVGRIQASGLTLDQLKEVLSARLARYITSPQVTLNLSDNQNQTVSVLGSVNTPGVHPLAGPRRLLDVLSSAGGVKADAGSKVILTRQIKWGSIPVTGARLDTTGGYSTVSLTLYCLLNASTPSENIFIRPGDTISIPKADIVYVIGNVKRAGGFPLSSHPSISVLQALSLAEGLDKDAKSNHARIIRPVSDGDGLPKEIPVDVTRILAGQSPDVPLFPNDVLFIPNSGLKSGSRRATEAILQAATGIVIYGR